MTTLNNDIEHLEFQMDGWIKDGLIHILEYEDAEHLCCQKVSCPHQMTSQIQYRCPPAPILTYLVGLVCIWQPLLDVWHAHIWLKKGYANICLEIDTTKYFVQQGQRI